MGRSAAAERTARRREHALGLSVLGLLPFDVPVEPDAPDARQLLSDELAKQPYQAARPTWFDLLSKALLDWLGSLRIGGIEGPPVLVLVVLGVLVLVVLVIAFLVYGPPRLNRRSRADASVFDGSSARPASELRREAERLAAGGDWRGAMVMRFRALAAGLAERTIVTPVPGTTAHEFARRAGDAFPEHRDALGLAAGRFDGVRYLDREGSELAYRETAALDETLGRTRPRLEGAALAGGAA